MLNGDTQRVTTADPTYETDNKYHVKTQGLTGLKHTIVQETVEDEDADYNRYLVDIDLPASTQTHDLTKTHPETTTTTREQHPHTTSAPCTTYSVAPIAMAAESCTSAHIKAEATRPSLEKHVHPPPTTLVSTPAPVGVKKTSKRRRYADEEDIPDELWECVLCKVKSHMTPLKRRGADGKRNLCNACYVRLRVRKERSERGMSRPVIPPGGFVMRPGFKVSTPVPPPGYLHPSAYPPARHTHKEPASHHPYPSYGYVMVGQQPSYWPVSANAPQGHTSAHPLFQQGQPYPEAPRPESHSESNHPHN